MKFKEWFLIAESKEEKSLAAELAGSPNIVEKFKKFIPQNQKETDPLTLLASYYYSNNDDLQQLENDFKDYIQFVKNNKMPLIKVDLSSKKPAPPFDNYLHWTQVVHGHKAEESAKIAKKYRPSDIDFQNEKPFLTSPDGKIKVYEANSPQQCIVLGRGQSFCISQPGNRMWKSYRDKDASTFYFVYDDTRDDELSIVVIDKRLEDTVLTDKNNRTGTTKDPYTNEPTDESESYLQYLQSKGINVSRIVNKSKTKEEEAEDEKLGKSNDDLEWFIALSPNEKSNYIGRGHNLSDEQFDYLWNNKFVSLLEQYVKTGLRVSEYQIEKITTNKDLKDNYIHNRILAQRNNHYNMSSEEYKLLNDKQKDFLEENADPNQIIYKYIEFNDFDKLKRIYNKHSDLDTNNHIQKAVQYGRLEIVKFLISKGASARMALEMALDSEQMNIADYLLQNADKLEIYKDNKFFRTDFLYAAAKNDRPDVIKKFISLNFQASPRVLNRAAAYGNVNVVKYLISIGIEPDSYTFENAIHGKNFDLIKYLVKLELPINQSAFMASINEYYDKNFEIFKYLYNNLQQSDKHIGTIINGLGNAIDKNLTKIKEFFEQQYTNQKKENDYIDPSIINMLIHKGHKGNLEWVKRLQKHVNPEELKGINYEGALEQGDLDLAKYFIDLGVKFDTPFGHASYSNPNNINIINYLLEKGYKPKIADIYEALTHSSLDKNVLKILLDNLENPKLKEHQLKSVLRSALVYTNFNIYKYLIDEQKILPIVPNHDDIKQAILRDRLDVVKYLVSKGVEIPSYYAYSTHLYSHPNSKMQKYIISVLKDRGKLEEA